jgi:ABC-type sugar transport system ATPase subunit
MNILGGNLKPESGNIFLWNQLRASGMTLIYISHALEEVLQISDDIVVLRDGEVVGKGPVETFSKSGMISLMVGRDIDHLFPPRKHSPTEKVALLARNISGRGALKNIDFILNHGEVLGISGLMGSGRTEFGASTLWPRSH